MGLRINQNIVIQNAYRNLAADGRAPENALQLPGRQGSDISRW